MRADVLDVLSFHGLSDGFLSGQRHRMSGTVEDSLNIRYVDQTLDRQDYFI